MKQNSIILVGSIALDTIETPFDSRKNILGGSTTYALLAAALKVPVHIVGVVGKDFPSEGWDLYRNTDADLSDLEVKNGKTFRWGGRYHANMEDRDTLFTELGVFETFEPKLSENNREQKYVFLANIHPDLQLNVLSQMHNDPVVVVDTMNLWIDISRDSLDKVLEKTDILLINESEAILYSEKHTLSEAAEVLRSKGPETVVIKRGSKGADIYTGNTVTSVGVYPVENVVDPTGAGDTFGGGFISALANGDSLYQAACRGSALASLCVEGFGPEKIMSIEQEELSKRIKEIQKGVIT